MFRVTANHKRNFPLLLAGVPHTDRTFYFLCNEAAAAQLRVSSLVIGSYAVNEKADNWVQLSPFGDFNNAKGMQRLRKEDSDSIVNEFNSPLNIQARIGLPWYVGHPDFPGFEKKYPDTEAKGRIKELATRADASCSQCKEFCNETSDEPCHAHGLFGRVAWNVKGKELITNEAYHGHSVNWGGMYSGGFFRPMVLKSVGFTNDPQIPVPPITTANEKNNMDKPTTLMGWIKLLTGKDCTDETMACNEMDDFYNSKFKPMMDGMKNDKAAVELVKPLGLDLTGKILVIALANELNTATAKIATLTNEKQTLANEKATLETDKTKLTTDLAAANGTLATVTNEKATLATERDGLKTQFTNERAEHAKNLGGKFIAEGRITVAELETVVNEAKTNPTLCNERVSKLPAKWRPGSVATNLKTRNTVDLDEKARSEQVQTFVNEKMDALRAKGNKKPDYAKCFAEVQKEKPELFEAMKQPEGMEK